MNEIFSAQNPRVKDWKKLQRNNYRAETGLFLAEGIKLTREAMEHTQVECVLAREHVHISPTAKNPSPEVISVSDAVINALCEVKSPEGVVAVAKIPAPQTFDDTSNIVALENVSDPGNLGAIIRTADAAGIKTVLLSAGCASAFSTKALRASMGSALHINLPIIKDFYEYLRGLSGYNIVAGALDGRGDFPGGRCCILIGNEANGLSAEAMNIATHAYKIPMPGGAESLNAAVAASLMIYKANGLL